MLALIAPDKKYVNDLLQKVGKEKEKCPVDTDIYKCTYKEHEFLIMVTGYGKVNLGSALCYLRQNYPVKVIFQLGTAGSINDSNDVFGAVIPSGVLQYDVDFTCVGYSPAQVPLLGEGVYQTNQDLVECAQRACEICGVNYSNDLIASADMYVYNNNLASSIRREYNAGAVDCECGSIGQFAYQNQIPFVCVKVISNFANNNSVRQYNLYDEEASKTCQRIAYKFLKEYYE